MYHEGADNEGYTSDASSATHQASKEVDEDPDPTADKQDSSLNGVKVDMGQKRDTVFFRDGVTRIDYILVYEDTTDTCKLEYRATFEENLKQQGLKLENEYKELSTDGKSNFVKVHATWEVLTRVAEILSLKMPLKPTNEEEENMATFHEGCCSSPCAVNTRLVPEEPDYFTADFIKEGEHMFDIKDKETFFNNAQRSLIVHELLLRTQFTEKKDTFGVDRLITHGVYTAAFPLHEGPYKKTNQKEKPNNDRQLLYQVWASPKCWYSYQPLDLIRRYFGEKIAIYFTWLGFYTSMLIPAALVGLAAFIYGIATLHRNEPSNEICDKKGVGSFIMCPLCDKYCSWWRLHDSCLYSQVTYLFDNEATVCFAAFMAIWATCFLEFWKRKQAELQYDWDVANFEAEEHMRPQFELKCKRTKKNPITQLVEPFLPLWSKVPRRITSMIVVLFMMCCVVAAVFGVVVYRIIVVAVLYAVKERPISSNAKIITSLTAAVINLIVILILNKVYEWLAVRLTEMERPRTDTEYEDSITFKMFLFQFINYYSSIFYLAFFKGSFTSYPGSPKFHFLGQFRQEECDPAGCLIELCIQLAIVMVGKQTLNNFKELLLPKFCTWCRSRNRLEKETQENLYTRWEQDNDLSDTPALGLFDEYLEMVIQYGFVTIFVAAFPLAPLFALLNNIVEIRLDAYKFIATWKRPPATRSQDIGIWSGILVGVSFIAVLTNAFIIAWTSDFIPKLVHKFAFSPDASLTGYVNASLSHFLVKDFRNDTMPINLDIKEFGVVTECRYKAYRESYTSPDKYEYTRVFWNVFAARLAFVIVFEHIVFFLTWLVSYIIPDVPGDVKRLMLREVYLAKEARYATAEKRKAE